MHKQTLDAQDRFAAVLGREMDRLAYELVVQAAKRVPDYAALTDGGPDERFLANVRHHFEVFCDVLRSRRLDEERMSFAYRAAVERAREGFSLAAILQSYQHVTRGMWLWATTHPELHDDEVALRTAWPIWLDYADRATRAAADAYLVVSRERVQADADSRRTLIDLLLSGRLTELEWSRWVTSFGYDGGSVAFHLVVLQWWDEDEYRVLDAAARTARALSSRIRAATGTTPVDAVRDRELILLLPATSTSPQRLQDEVVRAVAVRPSPDLSVSGAIAAAARGAAGIVDAYAQTLRVARVTRATGAVARVDQVGLFDHAVVSLRNDFTKVCRPELAGFIRSCMADPRDFWIPTIEAWADSDMNVGRAAQQLHVHRNTVYYRLSHIAKASGVDPHTVTGLADILIAVRLRGELVDS